MGGRAKIWIAGFILAGAAYWVGSTAGAIAAFVGTVLFFQGNAIEIKLNKLLDERGIVVRDSDLDA